MWELTPKTADDPGTTQVLAVGLIDFLQRWTFIKKVAMCVKVAERNKATIPPKAYGERFISKFGKKFIDDESVKELDVSGANLTRTNGTNGNENRAKEIDDPQRETVQIDPDGTDEERNSTSPMDTVVEPATIGAEQVHISFG